MLQYVTCEPRVNNKATIYMTCEASLNGKAMRTVFWAMSNW